MRRNYDALKEVGNRGNGMRTVDTFASLLAIEYCCRAKPYGGSSHDCVAEHSV